MQKERNSSVIIDNGSGTIKSGFAWNSFPKFMFPTMIGNVTSVSFRRKNTFIGDEADVKRTNLKLRYPIENGVITNWDDMEKLWHYTFYNQLNVKPEEHNVFMIEPALNPKTSKQKLGEILFEKFNIPGLFVSKPAPLPLYAAGRITGLVIDSGDGVTYTAPIYDGYTLPNAISSHEFAGRSLSEYLIKTLNERCYNFQTKNEIIKDIKEKLCFISKDYDKDIENESSLISNKPYVLPDGQIVSIGSERFKCPEALFRPSVLNQQVPGLQEMCLNSINKCPEYMHKHFLENIVLSGGSTMFKGFTQKLEKELKNLVPNVKIVRSKKRNYSVWIGGSVLASMSNFQSMWCTKLEYQEHGTSILYKKFL